MRAVGALEVLPSVQVTLTRASMMRTGTPPMTER